MEKEQDMLIAEAIRLGTQNLKEWKEYGRKWKSRYDEMIETCRIAGEQRDNATRWRWISDAPKDGEEVLFFSGRHFDSEGSPTAWIAQVGKYDEHDKCWVESHEMTRIYPLWWVPIPWHNANVDLPDTAAQDSASKSNSPAVSG